MNPATLETSQAARTDGIFDHANIRRQTIEYGRLRSR